MADPCDFDCVVIGAGPTGAVLASLLGQRGHRVLIVERDLAVYPLPRAVHMDHEVVRVLQEIGVAERLLPMMNVATEYRFENALGEVLFNIGNDGRVAVSGWNSSYMFVQPELEQTLHDRLAELASVALWRGHTCVGVEPVGDGINVVLRRGVDDLVTVNARYVIGCDGASSFVRTRFGIGIEDLGFDESWVVIDTRLKGDIGLPQHVAYQFCNPARPTTCVPAGPGRRRWEFMLLPGESRETISAPERVWSLLEPWGGEAKLDLVRVAVYRFHALLAAGWRVGRVLLAGDAAHQMPPFMGQGLCSGVRDAANLAWKLDLVLNGVAPESLLDSYYDERAPHVRELVGASVAMGRIVCERDVEKVAQRDAFMIAARRAEGSAAGGRQGAQAAPITHGIVRTMDAGAGVLFPQPTGLWRDRRGRLDDLVGYGWRLVVASEDLVPAAQIPLVTVVTLDGNGPDRFIEDGAPTAAGWLSEHGVGAALVRPDHYVFGTARTRLETERLVEAFQSSIHGQHSVRGGL